MSTLMEDRLTAALQARADQVQPEDLRPLDVPTVRRLPKRPFWGVLAAAAATAAILVPLAFDGGESARPAPAPSTEQASFRGDVDGDGTDDLVRLDRSNLLRVDLAVGARIESQLDSGAELMGLADLGVSGLAVVLDAGGGVGDAAVLRVVDGDLFPVSTGDREWIGRAEGQTFWVADRRLYTGMYDPQHLDREVVAVTVRSWTMPDDFLSSEEVGRWCWEHRTGAEPRPCGPGEEAGTDVGPRGDLPAMFPAVADAVGVGERVDFLFTSPDTPDSVRLEGKVDGDSVEAGQVELVVELGGAEHRADVPAGWAPRLFTTLVAARGDAPAFLVEQEGGDSGTLTVFSFWNGELRALGQPEGVPFGSGFQVQGDETQPFLTWITGDGALFTGLTLDSSEGRYRVWRWTDDLGETMVAEEVGEVCIDWQVDPPAYGTC